MSEEQLDKIREQYPVSYDEICKFHSFEQILGKSPEDIEPQERLRRWKKQMSFSRSIKQYWSDTSECNGCIHLNKKEAWCELQGLPCCVNPILTYSSGMIGMACMGIGKEEHKQLKLNL